MTRVRSPTIPTPTCWETHVGGPGFGAAICPRGASQAGYAAPSHPNRPQQDDLLAAEQDGILLQSLDDFARHQTRARVTSMIQTCVLNRGARRVDSA